MVVATGIDVIEIQRIHRAIERWGDRFLTRIFTPEEIRYCSRKRRPEISFAARFAAKEAVLKALGIGIRGGLGWRDVEIINLRSGAPQVRPGGPMKAFIGAQKLLVSLSHIKDIAVAVALLVDVGEEPE
jgi:holo-[acyl-carrier protein] synthase